MAEAAREHYEMAAYGTLVAWAQAMGHTEAAKKTPTSRPIVADAIL